VQAQSRGGRKPPVFMQLSKMVEEGGVEVLPPVRILGNVQNILQRDEWVAGIPGGLNVVHVSVANVRVDHEVKMADLSAGLRSPVSRLRRSLSVRGFGRSWAIALTASVR
jgi:hypothetical protein